MFRKRCAERGEPNRLLFVAKLESPTFSCGIRKKIIMIRKRFTQIPMSFNILFKIFNKSKILLSRLCLMPQFQRLR